MERLICFSVEGLKHLAGREVWMPLGSFATAGEAHAAAGEAEGVIGTRVVSCYRVSPPLSRVTVATKPTKTARPQSSLHVEA